MLLGVLFIKQWPPALAWLLFSVGSLVMASQFSRISPSKFKRSALQSGLLIMLAALIAPMLNYYSGWTSQLTGCTFAMLVILVMYAIWPCAAMDAAISGMGAVLFSIWTIHDIANVSCDSPFVKSMQIFLDVFNLMLFTTS